MHRRTFLQLGLAAAAGTILPGSVTVAAKAPPRPRLKRGLGIAARSDPRWRTKLEASGARWFYSWSPHMPAGIPAGIEFVPMIFGRIQDEALAQANAAFREQKPKYLLGFNEPDGAKQGNLTVEAALALWPKLMELGLPLGSPACIHPDNEWMRSFMQAVAARSLRVDFVTVHSYGGLNADALMKQLAAVHRLYRRPLWITEFAVGDWKARTPAQNRYRPEQVLTFMEQILPRLDRCDFVERYAWFSPKPEDPPLWPCALFREDGTLTPLGEAYRSL